MLPLAEIVWSGQEPVIVMLDPATRPGDDVPVPPSATDTGICKLSVTVDVVPPPLSPVPATTSPIGPAGPVGPVGPVGPAGPVGPTCSTTFAPRLGLNRFQLQVVEPDVVHQYVCPLDAGCMQL